MDRSALLVLGSTLAFLLGPVSGQSAAELAYPDCMAQVEWIGDGFCDYVFGLNVAECDFDGGDCCECECNEDAFYECGRAGFVCEDPDAVTTCTDLDDSSMSFFYYDDGDFDDDISGQTCDNGLQGVANKDVCCVLECGQCGGPGCSSIAGLTGDDCCTANIETNGELCSATGAAPCLMGTTSASAV